jgi:hypothetical protein
MLYEKVKLWVNLQNCLFINDIKKIYWKIERRENNK